MDPRAVIQQLQRPVLPQWFPPAGAYVQDVIDTFPTMPDSAFHTAFTFKVPAQRKCMVGYIAIDSNDPSAAATVSWRFLIDSSPHYNYQAPPAFIGTLDEPSRIWIELQQERTLELQFKDTALLAGHAMFYRLFYWFWNDQVYARPQGENEVLPEGA